MNVVQWSERRRDAMQFFSQHTLHGGNTLKIVGIFYLVENDKNRSRVIKQWRKTLRR